MADRDYDVIIAGGGVAGLATAAALREFNLSVLIVEPGQHDDRRLAGELIHPLGIAGLRELDLFEPAALAEAEPIQGFAVFPESGEASSRITLPYTTHDRVPPRAMAIDYGRLKRSLEAKVRRFGDVTFLDGARLKTVEENTDDGARIVVDTGAGVQTLTCRILVAADGASSQVRKLAGIGHTRRPISTIAGYVVENASLPAPGFGHVIIGGASIVLAYGIGGGRARVMFDQPVEQDGTAPAHHRHALLAAIPAPFRHQVADAMATQKPLSCRSAEVIAETTSRGSVVLVGDAGGSCHPLTATGMTIGICDGLRLRDALRLHGRNTAAAFAHYDRVRKKAQRSRRMVASALHDVCSRQETELRVVRAGLLRYWRRDLGSPSSTMAILGMTDDRITSIFWHLLKVMRHGLIDHWKHEPPVRLARVGGSARLVAGLGALAMRHVNASLRAR